MEEYGDFKVYSTKYVTQSTLDEVGYKHFQDEGKEAINKMLWTFLPGTTTLDKAESLAVEIRDMIEEIWNTQGETHNG